MSYTKQNWEDRDLGVGVNGTPVNAEHLNHMEDGIEANADAIEAVNADLTDKMCCNFPTDTSITDSVDALDVGWTLGRINSSGIDMSITGMPNNYNYVLAVGKYNANNAVIIALRFNNSSNYFYTRRKISGTWADWETIA